MNLKSTINDNVTHSCTTIKNYLICKISMVDDGLAEKIRDAGREEAADFIRENLHYLPKGKRELFHSIERCSGIIGESEYCVSGDYLNE